MNIFLVHGSFGKPFENWFPWLEEELSKGILYAQFLLFLLQNIKTIRIGKN